MALNSQSASFWLLDLNARWSPMRVGLALSAVALIGLLPVLAGTAPAVELQAMVAGIVAGGAVVAGGVPLSSGTWGTDYITVSHALRVGLGYGILPIAADLSAIANENVRLVPQIIRVEGKPARERLGDWTMNVWTGGGPPRVLKFTLQAAP